MRTVLAFLICQAAFCAGSWDSLGTLRPGDPVKILDTAGREYRGNFTAVTPAAISLRVDSGEATVERAKVRRVQVKRGSRRARNIAIGVAAGLAAGLVIDQTLGTYFRNESGQTDAARAVTYVAPIAVFGAIAAAVSPHQTVYKAP